MGPVAGKLARCPLWEMPLDVHRDERPPAAFSRTAVWSKTQQTDICQMYVGSAVTYPRFAHQTHRVCRASTGSSVERQSQQIAMGPRYGKGRQVPVVGNAIGRPSR